MPNTQSPNAVFSSRSDTRRDNKAPICDPRRTPVTLKRRMPQRRSPGKDEPVVPAHAVHLLVAALRLCASREAGLRHQDAGQRPCPVRTGARESILRERRWQGKSLGQDLLLVGEDLLLVGLDLLLIRQQGL